MANSLDRNVAWAMAKKESYIKLEKWRKQFINKEINSNSYFMLMYGELDYLFENKLDDINHGRQDRIA